MQALHVMTNWQLWTNTSQQMFKVVAFGFNTCIKTISTLINCLINDAQFDAVNFCAWRFFRHFSWMTLCMMRPTDLREMPVSLAIWWVVLCVPGAPSWLSTKPLTASVIWAVRDVQGLLQRGCRSVVPVSRILLTRQDECDRLTAVAMKQTLGRQVVSTLPVKHAAATPARAAVASVYC